MAAEAAGAAAAVPAATHGQSLAIALFFFASDCSGCSLSNNAATHVCLPSAPERGPCVDIWLARASPISHQ